MSELRQREPSDPWVAGCAAVPLIGLILSPAIVAVIPKVCTDRLCAFEFLLVLEMLIYICVPVGFFALGRAAVREIARGEWPIALALGLITVIAFYAAWALFTLGTLGDADPNVTLAIFRVVYDFPPGQLPSRAFDSFVSYLLMMNAPATLIVYGVLRGERKRVAAFVGLGAALLVLLIVRVTS